ncbi:MAG: reverse transcriptase family protein, partial [Planktothrix sp.]
ATVKEKTEVGELETLIRDYKDSNPEVGQIEGVEHTILLTSSEPISAKPYKIPLALREKTKEDVNRLLRLNIIQKSDSPYNSPALPIYKRNGSIRLASDYRKINSHTSPEAYPFSEPFDILVGLKGSVVLSQIDLSMGYYQISMSPESRKFTAFSIFGEHYEFLRMPFGLANAPRPFQKAMIRLLGDLEFVKVFLDDILVHSPDEKGWPEFRRKFWTRNFAEIIFFNLLTP